jgi:hypothetical protein
MVPMHAEKRKGTLAKDCDPLNTTIDPHAFTVPDTRDRGAESLGMRPQCFGVPNFRCRGSVST